MNDSNSRLHSMDSFTERMMERAKVRKNKLKTQPQNASEGTCINFKSTVSPLKELNLANSLNVESSCTINVEFRSPCLVEIKKESSDNIKLNLWSPFENKKIVQSPTKMSDKSSFKVKVTSPSKINSVVQSQRELRLNADSPLRVNINVQSPGKKCTDCKSFNTNVSSSPFSGTREKPSLEMEIDSILPSVDREGELNTKNPHSDQNCGFHRIEGIRGGASRRLKKLEALYGGQPSRVSSPIQQTEAQFAAEEINVVNLKPTIRSSKLAALAFQINQWENDSELLPSSGKKCKFSDRAEVQSNTASPQSKIKKSPVKDQLNPFKVGSPVKHQSSPSNVGSPAKKQSSPLKLGSSHSVSTISQRSPDKDPSRIGSVLKKVTLYEATTSPIETVVKDPSELTIAERRALFEKNKDVINLPKVPFGQPLPVASPAHNFKKGVQAASAAKIKPFEDSAPSASISNGVDLLSKIKMFENLEKAPVGRNYNDERQQDFEVLNNGWNKFKNFSSEPKGENTESPMKTKPVITSMVLKSSISSSPKPPLLPEIQVRSEQDESSISPIKKIDELEAEPTESFLSMKPIIVPTPKAENLYPSLFNAEIESESDYHSERNCSSEVDFEQPPCSSYSFISSSERSPCEPLVCASQEKSSVHRLRKRKSVSSDSSDFGNKDPYSNNCFLDGVYFDDSSPSPSKQSRYDMSSTTMSSTPTGDLYKPSSAVKSESNRPFFTHTVSFYRKSQNQNLKSSTKPIRKVVHQVDSFGTSSDMNESDIMKEQVEKKIQELQLRITTEQTVISQATQALDLCINSTEFSNSAEKVEAERLLLLAVHKRHAALNELQRLKVEGTLRPYETNSCLKNQGSLTISEIRLTIKSDAILMAAREGTCHHLVCLLKCNEAVFGTPIFTATGRHFQKNFHGTEDALFTNKITFHQLFHDFKITLEVYDLVTQSEVELPHNKKNHLAIKKKGTKLKINARKHKHNSRFIASTHTRLLPVKTSNFSMIGSTVFSLREISRTQFRLERVSPSSLLEEVVQLKMSCELSPFLEHKGFLTMFEDVSGFGAWHRRWCSLKGDGLSFWKYPDDEATKVPINTIDLNTCTTKTVDVVSSSICARLHTFMLETIRPAREGDVESPIVVRHSTNTLCRHLLSADTKEERIKWCETLNKTLAILESWSRN